MNFLNYIDGFLDKVFDIIEPYFIVFAGILIKLSLIVLLSLLFLLLCGLMYHLLKYIIEKSYKAYKKYKNEKLVEISYIKGE